MRPQGVTKYIIVQRIKNIRHKNILSEQAIEFAGFLFEEKIPDTIEKDKN